MYLDPLEIIPAQCAGKVEFLVLPPYKIMVIQLSLLHCKDDLIHLNLIPHNLSM